MCLGTPVLDTKLTISAAYLRNWTEPVIAEEEEGLSKGGIAGIVIACIVVFLFIVGLLGFKGSAWFGKCCKNKTQSLPDESPRSGDIERKETGLAGAVEIAHQPSNQGSGIVSPSKDLTRQPLSGLLDHDLGSSGPDLNATGQHLLSGKQSHEVGTILPNINVPKEGAAKAWNALDQEQHLSGPGSERALASKRNE